jgi:hypothetical protein
MSDTASISSSLASSTTSDGVESPNIQYVARHLNLRTTHVQQVKTALSRGFVRKAVAALSAVVQLTGEKVSHREQAARLVRLEHLVLRGVPRAGAGEGETKQDLRYFVQDIIRSVIGIDVVYKVLDVVRLGTSDVVVVKFSDFASRMEVARKSRRFSAKRRPKITSSYGKMGSNPIYVDDDLTPAQQHKRKSLWPLFRSLKTQGLKPSWRQHVLMYVPDPFQPAVPHPANGNSATSTAQDQDKHDARCVLCQKHGRSPVNSSTVSSAETLGVLTRPRQKARLAVDGGEQDSHSEASDLYRDGMVW